MVSVGIWFWLLEVLLPQSVGLGFRSSRSFWEFLVHVVVGRWGSLVDGVSWARAWKFGIE